LQYRGGDDSALAELVSIWERRLFYYIRRMVDSEEDAWDLLQEVWCRVIRNLGSVRDTAALPAWLFSIARNIVRNHHRDAAHSGEAIDFNGDPSAVNSTNEPPLASFDADELHWALGRLNVAHREALVLHFLEGFSLNEIAGILAIPNGTVKSRLYHAKKALRTVLEKEGQHHE
jgi:RNA polymerase sigma-70 factor (ECF subfamily)